MTSPKDSLENQTMWTAMNDLVNITLDNSTGELSNTTIYQTPTTVTDYVNMSEYDNLTSVDDAIHIHDDVFNNGIHFLLVGLVAAYTLLIVVFIIAWCHQQRNTDAALLSKDETTLQPQLTVKGGKVLFDHGFCHVVINFYPFHPGIYLSTCLHKSFSPDEYERFRPFPITSASSSDIQQGRTTLLVYRDLPGIFWLIDKACPVSLIPSLICLCSNNLDGKDEFKDSLQKKFQQHNEALHLLVAHDILKIDNILVEELTQQQTPQNLVNSPVYLMIDENGNVTEPVAEAAKSTITCEGDTTDDINTGTQLDLLKQIQFGLAALGMQSISRSTGNLVNDMSERGSAMAQHVSQGSLKPNSNLGAGHNTVGCIRVKNNCTSNASLSLTICPENQVHQQSLNELLKTLEEGVRLIVPSTDVLDSQGNILKNATVRQGCNIKMQQCISKKDDEGLVKTNGKFKQFCAKHFTKYLPVDQNGSIPDVYAVAMKSNTSIDAARTSPNAYVSIEDYDTDHEESEEETVVEASQRGSVSKKVDDKLQESLTLFLRSDSNQESPMYTQSGSDVDLSSCLVKPKPVFVIPDKKPRKDQRRGHVKKLLDPDIENVSLALEATESWKGSFTKAPTQLPSNIEKDTNNKIPAKFHKEPEKIVGGYVVSFTPPDTPRRVPSLSTGLPTRPDNVGTVRSQLEPNIYSIRDTQIQMRTVDPAETSVVTQTLLDISGVGFRGDNMLQRSCSYTAEDHDSVSVTESVSISSQDIDIKPNLPHELCRPEDRQSKSWEVIGFMPPADVHPTTRQVKAAFAPPNSSRSLKTNTYVKNNLVLPDAE